MHTLILVLVEVTFSPGDVIMRQGDIGKKDFWGILVRRILEGCGFILILDLSRKSFFILDNHVSHLR